MNVSAADNVDNVTCLLEAWSKGDRAALDRLLPLVYRQLRRIARRHLKGERPGHTLQSAALVNEVYLKLVGQREAHWQDRAHFFGVAAQLMRRILVDYARSRGCDKRGGAALRVDLDEAAGVSADEGAEVVALDEALAALSEFDERRSRVVELRYFGGLSIEETAAALSLSPRTVMREWTLAKAWLRRELSKAKPVRMKTNGDERQ